MLQLPLHHEVSLKNNLKVVLKIYVEMVLTDRLQYFCLYPIEK